jgi:hypothetical protein
MAEHVALWGREIEESPADLENGAVDSGQHAQHDPITEPIRAIPDGFQGVRADEAVGYVENDAADEIDASPPEAEGRRTFSYAQPFMDRRPGSAGSSLTFKPAPTPWYRTRRALFVPVAVIAVAVLLSIISMLLRSPAPEDPTTVTPTTAPAPSSVPPTSNDVTATLTSQPAPPAPPPPATPPPPPAQDAPAYQPRYQAPAESPAPKPEIGVTRSPISVSPKPVTPPTSAQVGRRNGDNTGW